MSKAPYPGYQPNLAVVSTLGDFSRTCLVVELLSLDRLTLVELAVIQETLEHELSRLLKRLPNLEKSTVVTPDRFDPKLAAGLRLSYE